MLIMQFRWIYFQDSVFWILNTACTQAVFGFYLTWLSTALINNSWQPDACTLSNLEHWSNSLSGYIKMVINYLLFDNKEKLQSLLKNDSSNNIPGCKFLQEFRFRSFSSGQFKYKACIQIHKLRAQEKTIQECTSNFLI